MRIAQIDLENVKSYQRERVVFTEGTNAICGPNGAGKSTLLEAVGFALFDFLPTTQGEFVREGEKIATVTVHLVDEDGKAYEVVRKCGTSSQYHVFDPEIGQKLTDGKAETVAWLYDILGVEESGDPSALFRDAVGVPQGLMTAIFLETPGNRKNTFNPLLRVDEYDIVWTTLREPARWLEDRIQHQKEKIAGFEGQVKALPDLRQTAKNLADRIDADEKRHDEKQAELEEIAQRKEELEGAKKRLDELERTVTRAEGEMKTLDAKMTEARSALARSKTARGVMADTAAGHEVYKAAQETLGALEKERAERDRLSRQFQQQKTELALAQQQTKQLEGDLEAIAVAETQMEALFPKAKVQRKLENDLSQAKRDADRLVEAQRNLEKGKQRLTELEVRREAITVKLDELAQVEEENKTKRLERERLDKEYDELTTGQANVGAELDQVKEQTVALEAADTAQCPVCESPLTPEHRSGLLARNRARQAQLESTLAKTRSRQSALKQEQEVAKKQLRELEKRARELPRLAEAETLTADVETQDRVVQEVQATVQDLAGAPTTVKRLEAELETLGDPDHQYRRAAEIADQRDEVEENLVKSGRNIDALGQQIADSEAELESYQHLDELIEAERVTRDAHTEAHERYLRHIDEAKALEERQARVEGLSQDQEVAEREYNELAAKRDLIAARYDPDDHKAITDTYEDLRVEVTRLEERVLHQKDRLDQSKTEIKRLQDVGRQLQAAKGERDELMDLKALLGNLRTVLRDAGPKVTKALVEVISLQAARLYTDIMGDYSARLRWTENYEILLTAGGRERGFQQLSGGEQMAAALAVRLALLREVSRVNVAFFDEPTANLDDNRRDNLAEQIMNVKGFSQLFVISHDDTFERDTDNVVRITKENGASRVAAVPVGGMEA